VRQPGGRNRLGFDVCVLHVPRAPLARKGAPGPRVGRYGVDVTSFDETGVRALEVGLERAGTLLVVDELGKMEFFSPRFVELLPRVFGAPNPLLGTIMLRRHPVADRYRNSPGVEVIHIDERNRDRLPAELAERLTPPSPDRRRRS
jgi:nucleoside-triphosphatase THEP1